jgi:hypothetical protein
VQSATGKLLNLNAVVAASPDAAAEYYPAIYWYSLLKIPPKSEFPGTGAKGNGVGEGMKSQAEWLNSVKTNGSPATGASASGNVVLQNPQPGVRGNLGQNVIENPGTWTFDGSFGKRFKISEAKTVELRMDATNIFNHPQPANSR